MIWSFSFYKARPTYLFFLQSSLIFIQKTELFLGTQTALIQISGISTFKNMPQTPLDFPIRSARLLLTHTTNLLTIITPSASAQVSAGWYSQITQTKGLCSSSGLHSNTENQIIKVQKSIRLYSRVLVSLIFRDFSFKAFHKIMQTLLT